MTRGVPFAYEEFRDDIQIVTERLVDKIDPPRFFPLVGPAQLHHCHWKATIYYKETEQSSYPFPVKLVKNRVQVVYIDRTTCTCRGPEAANADESQGTWQDINTDDPDRDAATGVSEGSAAVKRSLPRIWVGGVTYP